MADHDPELVELAKAAARQDTAIATAVLDVVAPLIRQQGRSDVRAAVEHWIADYFGESSGFGEVRILRAAMDRALDSPSDTPVECDCRPGLDGSGYHHQSDCATLTPGDTPAEHDCGNDCDGPEGHREGCPDHCHCYDIPAERLALLDVLSAGDGQEWPDLYENPGQQQIAETMYGRQADQLLASSWLAERDRVAERRGAEEALRGAADEVAAMAPPIRGDALTGDQDEDPESDTFRAIWQMLRDRADAAAADPSLTEQGRRLASERSDLIAAGADPADLEVPLAGGEADA